MPNLVDGESLSLALAERLGTHPGEVFEGLLAVTFEGGQRSEARLQPEDGQIRLSARVAGAHDGLPTLVLRPLLERNAPGGELSGGTLAVGPSRVCLEIVDVLPMALGARSIASLMVNQAKAAAALSHWIGQNASTSGEG